MYVICIYNIYIYVCVCVHVNLDVFKGVKVLVTPQYAILQWITVNVPVYTYEQTFVTLRYIFLKVCFDCRTECDLKLFRAQFKLGFTLNTAHSAVLLFCIFNINSIFRCSKQKTKQMM